MEDLAALEDLQKMIRYVPKVGREKKANRPDIVVKNHKVKTCLLIDMTVPFDQNILLRVKKNCVKILKYKLKKYGNFMYQLCQC